MVESLGKLGSLKGLALNLWGLVLQSIIWPLILSRCHNVSETTVQGLSRSLEKLTLLQDINLNFKVYIEITDILINKISCHNVSDLLIQDLSHSLEKLASLQTIRLDFAAFCFF